MRRPQRVLSRGRYKVKCKSIMSIRKEQLQSQGTYGPSYQSRYTSALFHPGLCIEIAYTDQEHTYTVLHKHTHQR